MVRTTQVQPITTTDESPSARRSPSSTASLTGDSFEITVEWSGRYSVDKTLALFAASPDSTKRRASAVIWLVVTPLASLVVPLVLEMIPLPNPLLGWQRNWLFFLSFTLRVALMNFCIDSQIDTYVPEQKLPLPALMLMNIVQSSTSTCAMVLMSALTGAFPMPFILVTVAPFHAIICWSVRFVFGRIFLPVERDPVRLQRIQQQLPQVMRLINFTMTLLYIYSFFAVAFTTVPEDYQVVMAVILQLIKVVITHIQWKVSHIGSRHESVELDECGDLATAHVASGGRFFHALFTTTCLQKSKSYMTLVVVVFFSVVQELSTIRGLRDRERRLLHASDELTDAGNASSLHDACFSATLTSIALRARQVDERSSSTLGPPRRLSRSRSFYSAFHPEANVTVHPRRGSLGPCTPPPSQPLTSKETAFLSCATRLLQCQEAALLRLYVEIFVPILYIVYVVLVQYTHNIEFLPALQLNDPHTLTTLAQRLIVQITVKVFTLVFILQRHCREPGGLQQLAFAVSSMRSVMLSNCVLNALCVFDFPLLHNGNDFSFQFKWLQHPT